MSYPDGHKLERLSILVIINQISTQNPLISVGWQQERYCSQTNSIDNVIKTNATLYSLTYVFIKYSWDYIKTKKNTHRFIPLCFRSASTFEKLSLNMKQMCEQLASKKSLASSLLQLSVRKKRNQVYGLKNSNICTKNQYGYFETCHVNSASDNFNFTCIRLTFVQALSCINFLTEVGLKL